MTNRSPTVPYCQGTNADGKPCQSRAVAENGWCYVHDPEVAEERTQVRRIGGLNSRKLTHSHLPEELKEVVATLAETVLGVKTGDIPPAVGNSVGSLCRAIVAAHSASNEAERIRSFEESLEKLEAIVGAARQGLRGGLMATVEQLEKRLTALLSAEECKTCATSVGRCDECGKPIGYVQFETAKARAELRHFAETEHQNLLSLGWTITPPEQEAS